MSVQLDRIEARARALGFRVLRLDWNERGDRKYLKVWMGAVPVTFTQMDRGNIRSWPESVDVGALLHGP